MSAFSLTERIAFYEQMRHLVSAGFVLSQAFKSLRENRGTHRVSGVLASLEAACASGQPLSDGMAGLPSEFGELEVNLVRAGEAGGRLEETLKTLSAYFQRRQEILRRVQGALFYPVFLVHVGIFVPALIAFVLEGLWAFLRVVGEGLLLVYGAVFLIWLAARGLRSTPGLARTWDAFRLSIPWYGGATTRFAVARFATSLGHLLDAGVSTPKAIELSAGTIGIPSWKEDVLAAIPNVTAGERIVDSLQPTGVLPASASAILLAGEEGGQLPEACFHVSKMMEDEGAHLAKVGCKVASLIALLIAIAWSFLQLYLQIFARLGGSFQQLGQ